MKAITGQIQGHTMPCHAMTTATQTSAKFGVGDEWCLGKRRSNLVVKETAAILLIKKDRPTISQEKNGYGCCNKTPSRG
jgi:hypothetical protein